MTANLVFDFPDPSPRFEFHDGAFQSSKKTSAGKLKNSKGFSKFRSKKGTEGTNNNNINNSNNSGVALVKVDIHGNISGGSPEKSTATATTTSSSSIDESIFDDFQDEMFDFGKGWIVRSNANSVNKTLPAATKNSPTHYELAPSKPRIMHRPLKLPNNPNQALHERTHSNVSSGYISEASEFSFDRVTVETNDNTAASSNVSWNFFEETMDVLPKSGNDMFVPYTGENPSPFAIHNKTRIAGNNVPVDAFRVSQPGVKNDSRSLLQQTNVKNKVCGLIDDISLSDRSHDIPMSGIVDSNQSIVSEISADAENLEDLQDTVKNHLKPIGGKGGRVNGAEVEPMSRERESRSLKTSPKSTGHSTAIGGPSFSKSALNDFSASYQEYKSKRLEQRQDHRSESLVNGSKRLSVTHPSCASTTATNTRGTASKDKSESMLQSFFGNVCVSLGFCGWYFCGVDTTVKDGVGGDVEMNKDDRQRGLNDTFIGKIVTCDVMNCHGAISGVE